MIFSEIKADDVRVMVDRDDLLGDPDPTAIADDTDVRDFARKMLDEIAALLLDKATDDQARG